MTAEITIVDLCEEREKRKEVFMVGEKEPKRPRLSLETTEFERLNQRLNLVENIVTRDTNHQVTKQPSKEEFEDLAGRVSRLEDRVGKIEKILGSIQKVFLGFPNLNQEAGVETKASKGGTLRQNVESCPPVTPLEEVYPSTSTARPEKSSSDTRLVGPVFQGHTLKGSDNAKQRTSVTNAPTIRHVAHSAVTITQVVTPTACPVVTPVITPVSSRSSDAIVTSSGNNRPMAPKILRMSMDSSRNCQLVATTNNNQQNENTSRGNAASKEVIVNPQGMEEVPEDCLGLLRIKQELFDDHPISVRKDETSLMRRDADNRILVYVDGDARKIRNKDEYAAVLGWNAIPNKSNIMYYMSNMKTNDVKKEAEIIASYRAIEHIKQNFIGTGPLKITIVTNYSKLSTVMKSSQLYSTIPTWKDQFTNLFHDDLLRLVQITRDIDAIWRTYQQNEDQERHNLRSELKQTLKASRGST